MPYSCSMMRCTSFKARISSCHASMKLNFDKCNALPLPLVLTFFSYLSAIDLPPRRENFAPFSDFACTSEELVVPLRLPDAGVGAAIP